MLYIIKEAYKEFEERVGETSAPKGEKTEMITRTIRESTGEFTVSDIHNACPGVGIDLIRKTLKALKSDHEVECIQMGRSAKWKKLIRNRFSGGTGTRPLEPV